MEDEDGTCLLDVLCDPQALNDFLHGTNELENEDLLISSSSGSRPSSPTPGELNSVLISDVIAAVGKGSPVSLLADNTPSQDTPPPGCVDLSFLEEALLGSRGRRRGPRRWGRAGRWGGGGGGGGGGGLRHPAAEPAGGRHHRADAGPGGGLAPPSEALSLYPPGAVLARPPPTSCPSR
ncbi:hypothetical protein ANANG_G00024200 [Anguilla anguilla]|uniref:Uncharacterized protein n=1 Tax=Anguilla anguilla TaxID=7936 RepID=A0A9D3N2Z1_ANGAN|nr:hypothetical protein ANANG_G00024200 [Anguilla anguilla]